MEGMDDGRRKHQSSPVGEVEKKKDNPMMNRRSLFASLLVAVPGLWAKTPDTPKTKLLVLRDGWPLMLVSAKTKSKTIETVLRHPCDSVVVTLDGGLFEMSLARYPQSGFSIVRFSMTSDFVKGHPVYRETWRSPKRAYTT